MASLRRKDLVKNGKFSRVDIIKRAYGYMNDRMCTQYRNDWDGALKQAWADARMEMERQNAPESVYTFNPNLRPSDLRPSGRANNFMYGY